MDANKLAAQITEMLKWIVGNPFGVLLWLLGCAAILSMTVTIFGPALPALPGFVRWIGSDVQKLAWLAGFLALMKHAGR